MEDSALEVEPRPNVAVLCLSTVGDKDTHNHTYTSVWPLSSCRYGLAP